MAVKKRPKTLSHGRPPTSRPKEHMTSERSRTIIRTHHRLQKKHAAALNQGDSDAAKEIAIAIEENGGIQTYQAASKQGQAKDRGGDSSKVLVDWLQQLQIINTQTRDRDRVECAKLKCLEVGALAINNAISRYPSLVHMTRIDLNSQGPGIEKQDFMERPLPVNDADRFDIISLSLVLNYVPDAIGRGEMLKRIPRFLRLPTEQANTRTTNMPALFLVLPLPCVDNSRYLDEAMLLHIMTSLGFTKEYHKNTSKLCYYFFSWSGQVERKKVDKKKLRDGPAMNNFCVVLN
ncbi:putative methyltransferase-domain-containing protein [Phaeosphaeriaceae sp. PMI808]|nr:putative methyltransferase-domain-containing protein [Phaeosphaeriaceae sp. PMI808]